MVLLLLLLNFQFSVFSNDLNPTQTKLKPGLLDSCFEQDVDCIREKLNFQAIELIHSQIDEDQDGILELSETKDFFKGELNITDSDKKSTDFHITDSNISVGEFWNAWKSSEAHNWTEVQVIEWLVKYVNLPKYVPTFKKFRISGKDIPRLATNVSFKSKILGISDPIARKRIQLMALDVVLFGSPLIESNLLKDIVLFLALVVGGVGIYLALYQNKKYLRERTLVSELNEKIEVKLKEIESLSYQKETESENDSSESTKLRIDMSSSARDQLEELLLRTWELERTFIQNMKENIDKEVNLIRDQNNKMTRKRVSAFSALKYGYFNSSNEIDTRVIQTKKSAEEYREAYSEFRSRWRQIKELCGLSFIKKQESKPQLSSSLTLEEFPENIMPIEAEHPPEDMNIITTPENKQQKFGLFKKRRKT